MYVQSNSNANGRAPGAIRPWICLFFALALTLPGLDTPVSAQGITAPTVSQNLPAPPPADARSILPLTYAQVMTGTVPVYAFPGDATTDVAPLRVLTAGYVWVSLADPQPVTADGQMWFKVSPSGYIRADQVEIQSPSKFQGVELTNQPDQPFGWVVYPSRVSATAGTGVAPGAPSLPRYTKVTVSAEQQVGDRTWYQIGENRWLDQRQVGIVKTAPRPPGAGPGDKWIEVNLFEQTLAAYQGDRMVYATLVSSGLPAWYTRTGLFRIWAKATLSKMSGRDGFPDYYYLQDVPWSMYFDKSIALHGTYWHDRFGAPHSHGCVNLAPADAQWLYHWTTPANGPYVWTVPTETDPGTVVWVHN